MVDRAVPMTVAEAEKDLHEQEGFQAELDALRPRTNWLSLRLGWLLEENHLAEKVRHALESR